MHKALDDAYDIDHMILGRDKDIKIDEEIWDKAMKHIYECGKYDPDMLSDEAIEALIRATYDTLMEGVNKGITNKVTPELRSALEENTFIFSGFKTHQELKEAHEKLKDENGFLKPFGQFLGDVRKINADYNELYLRAEYRFAQQSATMASKWNSWERRGVEMLQYRTAADDHVRPEHAALDGITRPRDDKFWDTMMPPNGWRCRCTVVPVDADDATETPADVAQRAAESVNQKPKQKIFNFNPGKTMKVFPPKHPYLPKGCGNCELKLSYDSANPECQKCNAVHKCIDRFKGISMYKREQKNLRQWVKENLPVVKVGKFESKRDVVNVEGRDIIVNKVFFEEVISKGISDDMHYLERLFLSKEYKEFSKGLKKIGKEASRHHEDAYFFVYSGDYKDYHLKIKTKINNDGEFMYAFEIEKVR